MEAKKLNKTKYEQGDSQHETIVMFDDELVLSFLKRNKGEYLRPRFIAQKILKIHDDQKLNHYAKECAKIIKRLHKDRIVDKIHAGKIKGTIFGIPKK